MPKFHLQEGTAESIPRPHRAHQAQLWGPVLSHANLRESLSRRWCDRVQTNHNRRKGQEISRLVGDVLPPTSNGHCQGQWHLAEAGELPEDVSKSGHTCPFQTEVQQQQVSPARLGMTCGACHQLHNQCPHLHPLGSQSSWSKRHPLLLNPKAGVSKIIPLQLQ